MNLKTSILLSAAFGGISPNLFRLAVTLTQPNAELPQPTYFLGLLIFALMGAGVAYIWEETNLKKAFYLGLGLPAFIQLSAGEISSTEMTAYFHREMPRVATAAPANRDMATPFHFIPAAFRQDSTEIRTITITLEKFIPTYTIIFASDENVLEKIVRSRPRELVRTFRVPQFATQFKIKIRNSFSEPQPLPPEPGAASRYRVTVKESIWKGLLEAIGFRDTGLTIVVVKEE